MKKIISVLLSVVLSVGLLAACGGDATTAAAGESSAAGDGAVKVGVVAKDLGTQSFNDDVVAGLKAAKGVEPIVLEVAAVSDVQNALRSLVDQGAKLIVVPSGEYKDALTDIAKENPDVKYIFTEGVVEGVDNVMSLVYRENEAAFLAGALAALKTQSNKVGAVLAISSEVQNRYLSGYTAGAKAINPDIEVVSVFTNSYSDTGKGLETAKTMYSQGVDYIGTYAGAVNLGVFQAAKEAGDGNYCFGAATGQFDKMPDKIVASVVKPIDKVLTTILQDFVAGKFDTSQPVSLGLKENGVELRYTTENPELLKMIEPEQATISDIIEKINNGEIEVPATEDELKTFDYKYSK